MFSILLAVYLRTEWLGQMATLQHFGGTAELFSKDLIPFKTPTSDRGGFQLPQTLNNPCHFLLCLMSGGTELYLTVVLTCGFLMTNDVEHLLVCLLAICISLEKCLFKSSIHFFLIQQIPTGYLLYIRSCELPCYSLHTPHPLLPFSPNPLFIF